MKRPFIGRKKAFAAIATAALIGGVGFGSVASAQTSAIAKAMVTHAVSDTDLAEVEGNVRPEVQTGKDLGKIADDTAFEHLTLMLQRSPERQQALDKFLKDVVNPKSAEFHHWVDAAEFGSRFGVANSDLQVVEGWLASHGITVNGVTANLTLDVSANARKITEAFHTEIHSLNVDGEKHIANMSNPKVPAALRAVLAGPVGLNDFKPRAMLVRRSPDFNTIHHNLPYEALVPLDLYAIYNFTPVFTAGFSGQGQTIAVIEDTDLFANSDWSNFRKVLGLSRAYPKGTLTVLHPAPPTGTNNCSDPGVNADDGEAAIDVEWASAAAPNASIVMVSCSNRSGGAAGFGGFIGMQNLFNGPIDAIPKIFSVSYGESEASNGATSNLFVTNLYALGAAEGVSIFVSSGDESAASSDANAASSTHGIGVSGWTSTPNNVSVGGTDFADTFLGATATFWNPANGAFFNSAKGYIPEIPWNDSCASQLIYTFNGFASAVGPNGFCNSAFVAAAEVQRPGIYLTTASGSGGPSGCATGTASTRSVVSGTCKGYPKPSWQANVFGNPADGVRDIPDVSLYASNGTSWHHFYVTCYSDTNTNNSGGDAGPCGNDPTTWAGFGGTSVSSPIMAGIQALINQRTDQTWGNPNPIYYAIANAEFGTTGNAACNSTAAGGPAASCTFYDITVGDIDVNCTARNGVLNNCFNSGGTQGALSTSNTVLQPAYPATPGWDYATGLGSVNAFNFVMNRAWAQAPPS
ncbi:MAG TPA: S53 family serine peptidase [Aliidongia sp.]|nr:S53 family serine peptidase [Aliidongia sp.]